MTIVKHKPLVCYALKIIISYLFILKRILRDGNSGDFFSFHAFLDMWMNFFPTDPCINHACHYSFCCCLISAEEAKKKSGFDCASPSLFFFFLKDSYLIALLLQCFSISILELYF